MVHFALSIVGAGIGAWLAATLAFSRYRKERSLDRVVEWYERASHALQRMQAQIELVNYWELRHGVGSGKASEAKEEVVAYLPEFRQVSGQRVLYGLPKAQLRIAYAEGVLVELVSVGRDRTEDVPVANLHEVGEVLWRTAHEVGVELRKELGLKSHLWEGPYNYMPLGARGTPDQAK